MIIDINNLDDSRKNDKKYRSDLKKYLKKENNSLPMLIGEYEYLSKQFFAMSEEIYGKNQRNRDWGIRPDLDAFPNLEAYLQGQKYISDMVAITKIRIHTRNIKDDKAIEEYFKLSEYSTFFECITDLILTGARKIDCMKNIKRIRKFLELSEYSKYYRLFKYFERLEHYERELIWRMREAQTMWRIILKKIDDLPPIDTADNFCPNILNILNNKLGVNFLDTTR